MPHIRQSLSPGGPLIQFQIGVSGPHADALKTAGSVVPSPVLATGLIDTGASFSAIDSAVIRSLGLTASGSVPIHTPSTGGTARLMEQFDVAFILSLPGGMHYTFHALPVVCASLVGQGIDALIGRDVLARGILYYDGFGGTFTLGF